MKEYNPNNIEPKWQKKWDEEGLYEADDESDKEHEYVLDMFPYPSGSGLHVGHVEGYTATDIYSRFSRMNGKEVLHPMGWDAFGLPAENYAIKTGVHPRETTEDAIETFTEQIKRLGLSYDWSREINTSKPEYYKWTQWLFTELFENDLAERKEANVNWCPSCQTVLANEQVVDGLCERCDTEVEQKSLLQWFFTITDYADDLIEELDEVDWPESTKTAQKNWIGRSEGAYIDFELNTDQRFVLLHGFMASPDMNFHPHLKEELEKRGHEVVVPELPNPDDPSVSEQVEYVLENVEFDENTVLLGHSLGTVVAMKVAEKLEQPLAELILVGAFIDPEFKDGDPRSFSEDFEYEFDFDSIKQNTRDIRILEAEEDDAISEGQIKRVHSALGGEHIVVPVDMPHARGKKEPGVVREALPHVRTFTTRPDTLFGATYLVFSPEHEKIRSMKSEIRNWKEVKDYIDTAKKKTKEERAAKDREKTGVKIDGLKAINPATGEEIPIYVADYVLAGYGTGAIMAVPAHDERDFAFANKYDIPIKQVIAPHVIDESNPPQEDADDTTRDVVHCIVRNPDTDEFIALEWKDHDWLTFVTGGVEDGEELVAAARREIREETGYTDLSFERMMPLVVRADFYAAHKDVNREINAHVLLFDLQSDDREEISDKEKAKHAVKWMPMDEMHTLSPVSELDYILSWFDDGAYAYTEDGELINSGQFTGLSSEEAKERITAWLAEKNKGEYGVNYKLRDWSIGRQRYWGVPIPIVYDPDGNPHAVPKEHLPWELPTDVEFEPHGEAPLAQSDELKERTEKIFGEGWTPEVDTMDAFVCSSWYYLRFADPQNTEEFASKEAVDAWLPVDLYMGGAEHTVMHLLYARFITKVLNDLGYVDFREPFAKLRHQGMILAEDGRKMSKSLGNVVNPNDVVDQFGADSIRLFEMFLGPLADAKPWQTDSIVGVRRFLERVWRLAETIGDEESEDVETKLHQTIKKVTDDTRNLKFNTAIAALMECVNLMEKKGVTRGQYEILLQLLGPYAPHMTEEIWREILGKEGSIHTADWPEYDEKKATEDTITIAVQVDGVVRGELEIDADASEEVVTEQAKQADSVEKWIEGRDIKREIYVDGRLVNFVTE